MNNSNCMNCFKNRMMRFINTVHTIYLNSCFVFMFYFINELFLKLLAHLL